LSRTITKNFKSSFLNLPRFFSAKEIRFGSEARAGMMVGCDKLTDAVQVT